MSQTFKDVKVNLEETLEEKLNWLMPGWQNFHILRKSVDARRNSVAPHWVYTVEVFAQGEAPAQESFLVERVSRGTLTPTRRPIIIGSGPAGLFAALRLVERGIPCVLLERGSTGARRIQAINRFWRYGELDENNNVCFGEGGAGLYSDGKLITRIKSPWIPYVMDRLIRFGAPEEIRYLANPHVGSDRIRRVIPKIREFLQANGCELHFDTKMTALLTESENGGQRVVGVETEGGTRFYSDFVVLATGHSAEDVLEHLHATGVQMEGKSYALGLRIEHPQAAINRIQYRDFAEHPSLGAANYRLARHDDKSGIGVYSFCMCPGGYVLSAGTSVDGVVCNGMSNYARNSPFANAAMVVSIDHGKLFGTSPGALFAGLKFRRKLERQALHMVQRQGGTRELPAQKVVDFINGRGGDVVKSSSPSGVVPVRLDELLPAWIRDEIRDALQTFQQQMKGFVSLEAQFHGIESRTSCPVRVTRDPESLQSISHRGLYPTGEGAGYAGGITSAACDGIRVAEAITQSLSSQAQVGG